MFNVQQFVADKKLEPYDFIDYKGEKQQLPNLLLFTSEEVNVLMAGLDTDPIAALSEIAPDLIAALKAIPAIAVHPFALDYIEHCTADKGEAVASPAPVKSTARPSKRTSPATTKARTRKR